MAAPVQRRYDMTRKSSSRPPASPTRITSGRQTKPPSIAESPEEDRRLAEKVAALHDIAAIAVQLAVSERTVRRLIASGVLPAHRIGRSIRVSTADRDRFLAGARQS